MSGTIRRAQKLLQGIHHTQTHCKISGVPVEMSHPMSVPRNEACRLKWCAINMAGPISKCHERGLSEGRLLCLWIFYEVPVISVKGEIVFGGWLKDINMYHGAIGVRIAY